MPEAAGRPQTGRVNEAFVVDGTVREALPNALFRVELASGSKGAVIAHVAGESSLLRLRPGDQVVVELAPYDTARGRVVRRR
jgi:translation initiation factor IF-1